MRISEICIERPVFATMLVTALVVLGLFSYRSLGVDLYPKVDMPNVVITTRFPGAGPEEVENQITKVIEEGVNTVAGLNELRSNSFEGFSQVIAIFDLERDGDECAQDVRDRVSRVLAKLPQGVDSPTIEKMDPDAAAVITVVVSGTIPMRDLTELAKKRIQENLETVTGVGRVNLVGGQLREIRVDLDPGRLLAHGLTAADVKRALQEQNVETPGGLVEEGARDLVLRTMGRIERVSEFEEVVVKEVGGRVVHLRDIAQVVDAEEEPRTRARLDGENAVALQVQKQSGMNTVKVIESVKSRLAQLEAGLPAGVKVTTVRDQSRFILGSFHAVMEHIVVGALLASFVVLLFLGDFRTTVMVALSIPISVISTFTLMKAMGFTLDSMTLLALALSVGLVIDDAIVVHENAFRHMEELGKERGLATRDAVREIGLAVMATTFSLVVIFLPVAFMPGIVGRFLGSFGLTMTFAILVSLVVSFTLTPMLCGNFLKLHPADALKRHKRIGAWIDWALDSTYGRLLRWSMHHRWVIVVLSVLCVIATVPLAKRVKKDFVPSDDQSEFLIGLRCPEGTSLARTSEWLAKLETKLRDFPEVDSILSTIGEGASAARNEASLHIGLVPIKHRQASQFAVMERTRALLRQDFPELVTFVNVVSAIGGGQRQFDIQFSLQGPDLEVLRRYSAEIEKKLGAVPGIAETDSSLRFGKPELRVIVDRARAASLGVKLSDLASTLRTLVGGDDEQVTQYRDPARGEEYEVRVRLEKSFRQDATTLAGLPVKAREGLVPLGRIARVVEDRGATQIERCNRQRQVSLMANLQGTSLGEAQTHVRKVLDEVVTAPGYRYEFGGRSKTMQEQNVGFLIAFGLSALFMYMILAAQFESFVHPVTILLSLPLCIPFGILSLIVFGEGLNLWSTLGLFMLFGIVKKNAILQIDYTNVLRAEGKDRLTAILESNRTRLRPILMTTLTLIAGMVPMAFSEGPGSGSRRGMAIVIIGGQALCLLVTLLLAPVAYSIFDDMANSRVARWLRSWLD